MSRKAIKLEKLSCGIHYGRIAGAKCNKCASGVVANNASNERKRMLAWAVAAVTVFLALAAVAESGTASWYGEELRGRAMANGKPFNPDAMTCASWNYPLGTKLDVQHVAAGITNTVRVTVTDRGPNKRLGRVIDLSKAAFAKLAENKRGLITVQVTRVPASNTDRKGTNNERRK